MKKTIFVVLLVLFSYGLVFAAYNPVPSDYKSKYNPATWASGEKTLELRDESPASTFRVFIPGGTVRISFITYCGRDIRLGIVSRFSMQPQCSYNISNKNEKEYYAVP